MKAPHYALMGMAVGAALVACESDYATAPQPGLGAPAAAPAAAQAPAAAVDPAADAQASALVTLQLRDEDFVESSTHRDPFRSFARVFKLRAPEAPQREVIMATTSVDEMKLIAIVTGTPDRAMFTDPHGVGYVVRRGDYIGRAEIVQTGGEEGMGVTLNWRVDRIRTNEVVLSREDPTAPDRPALTRVLPLHPPDSQNAR